MCQLLDYLNLIIFSAFLIKFEKRTASNVMTRNLFEQQNCFTFEVGNGFIGILFVDKTYVKYALNRSL